MLGIKRKPHFEVRGLSSAYVAVPDKPGRIFREDRRLGNAGELVYEQLISPHLDDPRKVHAR
jgi:hypothetical protein